MIDLAYYLTNLLFFGVALLYYYINLRSSIISSIFLEIFLSLGIFLANPIYSVSFFTRPELFCGIFETFVILTAILLPIKSPVASAEFGIALSKVLQSTSVIDCLA